MRKFLIDCANAYSKPERIEGTWAQDFEFFEFFEGQKLPPKQAWRIPDHEVHLDIEGTLAKNKDGKELATVSYIVFEGRRPLCHFTPGETLLIVDRVLSSELIEARVSKWN